MVYGKKKSFKQAMANVRRKVKNKLRKDRGK
jgi:hypothetical protein